MTSTTVVGRNYHGYSLGWKSLPVAKPAGSVRAMPSDWLSLYALAGHMAADFPLQTDHMAAHKFESDLVRAAHVAVHAVAQVPTVLAADWSWRQRATFLATLAATHYAIDTRRWAENFDGFPTRGALVRSSAPHRCARSLCGGGR